MNRRMLPTLIVAAFGLGMAFVLWDAAHGMDALADVVIRKTMGVDI